MNGRQLGKVVALKGAAASVQIRRQGACGGRCAHGRILGDADRQLTVEAENAVGAKVGDWVEVSFDTRLALKAAFSIYLLPILLALAVYAAGHATVGPGYALAVNAAAGLTIIGTFWRNLRRYARAPFHYSIVAFAREGELPVAEACRGCALLPDEPG